MNDRNHNHMDPWDRDSYETGSTNPPKSHGGLVAVLLILVILLCGISSALGVINIRLAGKLEENHTKEPPAIFYPQDATDPTSVEGSDGSEPSLPHTGTDVTVDLNKIPGQVENIPQTGGISLQEIYERNIASVVSISCTLDSGSSTGTGVVLTANGYIVTNCHVVAEARSIQVLLTDGRKMNAVIVGTDAVSDLAVLYVATNDLRPAQFGDSSQLRVGDAVVAIGDPLGIEFRGTMTDGIVSAINRNVTTGGRTMTLIQTNAALNSGNSGGPLINCYGQVVGINTMKIGAFSDEAGVEGLGFAIPSTTVKEIVEQLIRQGYVSGRPAMHMQYRALTGMEQRWYSLPSGLLVQSVTEGGAADKAGMEAGDVIVGVDGKRIRSVQELDALIYAHNAGDSLQVTFYRNRNQHTVTLTLGQAAGA